ncbi:MAG: thermonuclease family protein [Rhizobiaceae bacterium]|nr:thermonuclease family protein [Rhizobiaceae bacterium]MCV0407218.1 thermonuclease family protein [Rhizobiaceae bacterium]
MGWIHSDIGFVWDRLSAQIELTVGDDTRTSTGIVRPRETVPTDAPSVITLGTRSSGVNEKHVSGRAAVVDGDTLEIRNQRIRLNGVDAPESDQLCQDDRNNPYRCGAEAAAFLDKILAESRPAKCEFVDRDQYDRMVADCFRADGQNVAAMLVANGHALDWPRYSHGRYASDQKRAQAAKQGVWHGTFIEPWAWREAHRQRNNVDETPARLLQNVRETGACRIKGNINAEGERIYHIPGQPHYERTKISPQKGERWFCSETEARSAGWRRSKG